jgi:hypothetical protein
MSFVSSSTRKSGLAMLLALLVVLVAAASVGRGDAIPSTRAGTLTDTGPMHTARSAHTATLLLDGQVLITGGFSENDESRALASAELYDPAQGVFTKAGALTTGRQSHSATLLSDGRVLIAGGYDGSYLASAELYDPQTGAFSPTGSMSVGRIAHRATRLADGKVLITGGAGSHDSMLASAEIYDPQTGRFTPTGNLTTARISHTQTLLTDGTVLITGGAAGRRRSVSASAEIFDPSTGTFSATGAMTTVRYKHAAVWIADGRVLIVGGSDAGDWHGRYDSAEIFDPSTGVFTGTGRLNTPRFKLRTAVTLLADGRVLVAGGAEAVEIFDPQTERFTTIPGRLDAARFFSMATRLNDGHVLITGGYDRKIQSTNRAWLYQP